MSGKWRIPRAKADRVQISVRNIVSYRMIIEEQAEEIGDVRSYYGRAEAR